MQNAKLTWVNDAVFVASDTRGHSIVLDVKREAGGSDSGVQPLDLMMFSVAGCMGYDIVSILQKKRSNLQRMTVEVEGERAPDHPKRYTRLRLKIRANPEVNREDIQRAFELSRDKYCSVLATLRTPPEFEFDVGTE
jgi:putative redox protein